MITRLRRFITPTDADRDYNSARIDMDAPWRTQEFLSLDFETTGLDLRRDHIVAYGAVPVIQGRIRTADAVAGLVRPRRAMSSDALRIHCLHPRDLEGAPPLSAAVAHLVPALTGRVVIAHCSWIERTLLRRAMAKTSGASYHSPMVDTDVLARHTLSLSAERTHAMSLEWLAGRLGMPVHTPHLALGDAMTTAGVFLALAHRLETQRGALTVRQLLAASTNQEGDS
jgi:DNA polymerase III subunit epsilon